MHNNVFFRRVLNLSQQFHHKYVHWKGSNQCFILSIKFHIWLGLIFFSIIPISIIIHCHVFNFGIISHFEFQLLLRLFQNTWYLLYTNYGIIYKIQIIIKYVFLVFTSSHPFTASFFLPPQWRRITVTIFVFLSSLFVSFSWMSATTCWDHWLNVKYFSDQ